MKYEQLVREISHKKRSIQELITYITTKSDESNPNYSLLLGAGASATSGIKSGQDLVSEWRKDIYTRLAGKEYTNDDEAVAYLSKEEGSWYTSTNEYSSLFEKKFDLPAQRRRFVESEVDGIFPSIGYSYLVSLASDKNKYLDTIYTTNFDDLINESFYQFSQTRPIVCAHDSSVNSLSISSSRPKVIKLHGDYLFDDIKSTLRETESLESNIKNKFTHFSKEYGLVVVGYAGNDRSIMDIINHLLKTDEYFKNGIYWCLRRGDVINSELRKLLWKDRVYFVEIEGFDQLFAEIHHSAKGSLSLQNNFNDTKKEKIVANFAQDKYKLGETSEKIKEDIKQIIHHKNEFDLANLIREVALDNDNNEEGIASNAEIKELLEIDKLISCKNYKEAESAIKKKIDTIKLDHKKTKFMVRLINTQMELNKTSDALQTSNELMAIDPYSLNYVCKRLNLIENSKDSCEFLFSIKDNFKNAYKFYNIIIETALDNFKKYSENYYFELNQIEDFVKKSLSLNASLDNHAWALSVKLENEIYEKSKDKQRTQNYLAKISALSSSIEKINPEHMRKFDILEKKLEYLTDFSEIENACEELFLMFNSSNIAKKNQIIEYIQKVTSFNCDYKNVDKRGDFFEGLLKSNFFESCKALDNSSYFILMADYQLVLLKNKESAISHISSAVKASNSHRYLGYLTNFICNIENAPDKALDLLNSKRKDISFTRYHNLMSEIYFSQKLFEQALSELDSAFKLNTESSDYLTSKSYILLHAKRYQEVINIEEILNDIPFEKYKKKVMRINIETAKKHSGIKIDELMLRNLIGQSKDNSLKICAASLLGDDMTAKRLIKIELSRDYSKIYDYRKWPAIDEKYLANFDENIGMGNVA
jgi:hypothetical protein